MSDGATLLRILLTTMLILNLVELIPVKAKPTMKKQDILGTPSLEQFRPHRRRHVDSSGTNGEVPKRRSAGSVKLHHPKFITSFHDKTIFFKRTEKDGQTKIRLKALQQKPDESNATFLIGDVCMEQKLKSRLNCTPTGDENRTERIIYRIADGNNKYYLLCASIKPRRKRGKIVLKKQDGIQADDLEMCLWTRKDFDNYNFDKYKQHKLIYLTYPDGCQSNRGRRCEAKRWFLYIAKGKKLHLRNREVPSTTSRRDLKQWVRTIKKTKDTYEEYLFNEHGKDDYSTTRPTTTESGYKRDKPGRRHKGHSGPFGQNRQNRKTSTNLLSQRNQNNRFQYGSLLDG